MFAGYFLKFNSFFNPFFPLPRIFIRSEKTTCLYYLIFIHCRAAKTCYRGAAGYYGAYFFQSEPHGNRAL